MPDSFVKLDSVLRVVHGNALVDRAMATAFAMSQEAWPMNQTKHFGGPLVISKTGSSLQRWLYYTMVLLFASPKQSRFFDKMSLQKPERESSRGKFP